MHGVSSDFTLTGHASDDAEFQVLIGACDLLSCLLSVNELCPVEQ